MFEDFEEIVECAEIGDEETIDLEIDSEFHNFYANDICVSNSHCVSYGYIACQTLFLKHYYPTEFYTCLLNHVKSTKNKEEEKRWLASAIGAAMSKGISVLPPSRKSGWNWTMTGEKEISMGFSGINGFGEIAYRELCDILEKAEESFEKIRLHKFLNLPFSKFNKSAFEACLKAGIFDDWSESREYLRELRSKKRKKNIPGQMALFDLSSDEFNETLKNESYPPTTNSQKTTEFVDVCNFDLEKIQEIAIIKNELYHRSGKIIESVLNFSENGYYFFYLDGVQEAISEKGGSYLNVKLGDGISFTTLRVFPARKKDDNELYDKVKVSSNEKGYYVSEFIKNAKGFINFKNGGKFKKIK